MSVHGRTQQTGWVVNGQFMTLREGRKALGLRPVDVPAPRWGTAFRWFRALRAKLARGISP